MTTSDRAAEAYDKLINAVAALRTDQEWMDAMAVAASMHDYSFGNWLLMWAEAERRDTTVTRPAGYKAWQKLGRQVRKGEAGYTILAPMLRRIDTDDDDGARVLVGFRTATVFDVSQTDGPDLPDVGPIRLDGDGLDQVTVAAVGIIGEAGYDYAVAELPGHSLNGRTDLVTRTVTVRAGLSGAQTMKTTLHELAHVLLHTRTDVWECRGTVEVEAEAVAYVVAQAAGLDTAAYSMPYVALWAERANDGPERALLATAERVVKTARTILAAVEAVTEQEVMVG